MPHLFALSPDHFFHCISKTLPTDFFKAYGNIFHHLTLIFRKIRVLETVQVGPRIDFGDPKLARIAHTSSFFINKNLL